MPRKKVVPPIEGLPRNPEEKLIVQKSRPLQALWQSDFTLAEFKLLDTYLARINTRDPEHRTVQFRKGELETALGVTKINKQDLISRLKHLYKPVQMDDPKEGSTLIGLFELAQAVQDADGRWLVRLTCTPAAMQYIFGVEELGYLRYKLHSVIGLTSRYAYLLYVYLEANRIRKSWTVSLDDLKVHLRATEDTYSEYKRFNDLVLKKAQKEITSKTDTRFTYTAIRDGRSVKRIRFSLATLAILEPKPLDPNQLSLFADHLVMLRDIFAAYAMPDADLELVYQQLLGMPESALPQDPGGGSELVARQAQYLRIIAAKMARSRKPIPHPCSYICTIIRNEAAAAQTKQEQAAKQSDYWGGRSQVTDFEKDMIAKMIREGQELEAAEQEK